MIPAPNHNTNSLNHNNSRNKNIRFQYYPPSTMPL